MHIVLCVLNVFLCLCLCVCVSVCVDVLVYIESVYDEFLEECSAHHYWAKAGTLVVFVISAIVRTTAVNSTS